MKYSIDKQDDYSIFNLEEENLNSVIAPQLKSEFIFLRNEGVPNLVLDMEGVKYVDSSGLSAILTANRLWKDTGVFVMTGIDNAGVQRIIEISRLHTILNITKDIDEAVELIRETANNKTETEQSNDSSSDQ
jgi:anti-anti-sigma factor